MKFRTYHAQNTVFFLGLGVFLLAITMPVSAVVNGTIIEQNAVVFIGEQGLNLTHALNGAYYGKSCGPVVVTCPDQSSVPPLTLIGWWPSAGDVYDTPPSQIFDITTSYSDFTIAPGEFVGYTGNWYLLDPDGRAYSSGLPGCSCDASGCLASRVFIVADPTLDIRIWDYTANLDVTGRSVPRGERLGFRINTNMYPAVDGRFRGNAIDACGPTHLDPAVNGFIDIRIMDGSNGQITTLYNNDAGKAGAGPNPVLKNFVKTQPFFWGKANGGFNWDTGAYGPSGLQAYPAGTYTVSAESSLNKMRDNYKQGGADYTGKTVSQAYTIRLEPVPEKIGVFRPSTGTWYFATNLNGVTDKSFTWGTSGDIPITGDFFKDNYADIALFRPSTGKWYFDWDLDGASEKSFTWGKSGDIPLTGDFNADGDLDIALFRPSTGTWYFDFSPLNGASDMSVTWGKSGDIPLTGDFNGGGFTDIALFRPSTGTWYFDTDVDGASDKSFTWGASGDVPMTGDFDANRITDIALFRPSTGKWYFDFNLDGISEKSFTWGTSGDIPLSGYFNDNGYRDIVLFRPSTGRWYFDLNLNGVTDKSFTWGKSGDKPVVGRWK